MQSYRAVSKIAKPNQATIFSRSLFNAAALKTTSRKMSSLFPRSLATHHHNESPTTFHPLFRLLEDFDQYSQGNSRHQPRSVVKSFTPKFDVKETNEAYELHGELPGVEEKDITIEFIDAETLIIKGYVERSYTSGTRPNVAEGSAPPAIEDSGKTKKDHQPTVEDEGALRGTTSETPDTEVFAKADEPTKFPEAEDKFWVSERSVGEFMRTFTFPARVDQDAVKASMKNGVLSVVVPKGKKAKGRRIAIE